MIVWTERYTISTLCRPDYEVIEKTKDTFRNMVGKIMHENPDFEGHLIIGHGRVRKRHDIELANRTIPVVRIEWTVTGDRFFDLPRAFFQKWKEYDNNPLRSFRVEQIYSLPELEKLTHLASET